HPGAKDRSGSQRQLLARAGAFEQRRVRRGAKEHRRLHRGQERRRRRLLRARSDRAQARQSQRSQSVGSGRAAPLSYRQRRKRGEKGTSAARFDRAGSELVRALLMAGFLLVCAGAPALAADETVSLPLVQAEKLISQGQSKDAIVILDAYIARHDPDVRALVDRGDAYEGLGDQHSAIADYTAAIVLDP